MDGGELLGSASAGSVSGSSALLERHAARVDDLALAMLGDPRTPLDVGTATFLEASVRLYGLEGDDPLKRWLLAVNPQPEAPGPEPAIVADPSPSPPGSDADVKHLASAAFQRSAPPPSRSLPRPSSASVLAPVAPVLVLKVSPSPSPSPSSPAEAVAVAAPSTGAAPPAVDPSRPSPNLPGPTPAPAVRGDRIPPPGGASASRLGHRAGPRKLLTVGAFVLAALLLGIALLVAVQDDERTALRSGTTQTSAPAGSPPPSEAVPSSSDAETDAFLLPTVVAPLETQGGGTTVPPASTTAAPPRAPAPPPPPAPPAGSGSLFPTLDKVGLPVVNSTVGTGRGTLPLRNRGTGPLTYSTRSSFAGLTVDKPTGTIGPGATTELAVTLDGSKAGEGPFAGTLTFDGSGGTQQVAVTSVIGRPPVIKDAGESCPSDAQSCSQLIQLVPGSNPNEAPTPCNTPWRYSVNVEDESQLKTVRATANLPGTSAPLKKEGALRGSAGLWQSDVLPPLGGPAALSFTIEVVDEFDFGRTRPAARTIEC